MNLSEQAQDEMQKLIMRSKTNLNDLISSHQSVSEYRDDDKISNKYMASIAEKLQGVDDDDNGKDEGLTGRLLGHYLGHGQADNQSEMSERLEGNLLDAESFHSGMDNNLLMGGQED